MRRLAVALALSAGLSVLPTTTVEEAHAADRSDCATVEQAFLDQGASPELAQWFAYRIAWRESGCSPVYVHHRRDWSYSTVGLNGSTAGLRRAWMRLCGRDVRTWDGYESDARCALAAYDVMGTRPWRATR